LLQGVRAGVTYNRRTPSPQTVTAYYAPCSDPSSASCVPLSLPLPTYHFTPSSLPRPCFRPHPFPPTQPGDYDTRNAKITFLAHDQARHAVGDKEAVFNNRFIQVPNPSNTRRPT
jgi:hypothetical protein